jgi:hypothetical protein
MAFNWGAGTAGALGGAGSGAYLGSFGGPTGITIGALLGALAGGLGGGYGSNQGTEDFFSGTPGGIGEMGKFNPQQLDALRQILGMGIQQYQNPYEGFEPIRQDIGNYFKSDILPHIQNQFNAQTGGHYSSGILGSNIARGTQGLAEKLASVQAQYGQEGRRNALGLISQGLQPLTNQFQQQGQQGLWGQLAPTIGKAALGAGAGYLGSSGGENTKKDILEGIWKVLSSGQGGV